MLFCPRCANLLLIDNSGGALRWKCQTCPYTFKITEKMRKFVTLETRKDDAVYGDSSFRAVTEMGMSQHQLNIYFTLFAQWSDSFFLLWQRDVPNAVIQRRISTRCKQDLQTNLQLYSTSAAILVVVTSGRKDKLPIAGGCICVIFVI